MSSPGAIRRPVGLVLGGAVLATLVVWLLTHGEAQPASGVDADLATASTNDATPRPTELVGEPARRPDGGPAPVAPIPTVAALPRGAADGAITGRILDNDGRPVSHATVWSIVRSPGSSAVSRVEATVGFDGSFTIRSDGSIVGDTSVRICIAVAGYESIWTGVANSAASIEVRLPTDLETLRGQIVDKDGRAVPDLPIRLTDAWTSSQYVPLALAARTSDVEEWPVEARFVSTRTDASGRFEVRVRSTRGLGVLSGSPLWFLRDATATVLQRGFVEGRHEARLIAEPAVTLRASVLDASSGANVERFEGHAHDAESTDFVPFAGASGALAIAWPRWWKVDERRTIDVDVEAKGYAPARAITVYEAGVTEARADLRLEPATAGARADVTFDIRDAGGRPFDGRWIARIVDPLHADKTVMNLELTRASEGIYVAPVPEGNWTILVKTGEGLGFIRRVLSAYVKVGSPITLRCDMPAHGSLSLAWPKSTQPDPTDGARDRSKAPMLNVSPSAGGTGSGVPLPFNVTTFRVFALPEGDFAIELYPAGLASKPFRRTVRIVAGTEASIDFTKP